MKKQCYILLLYFFLNSLFIIAQKQAQRVNIWQGTEVRANVPMTPHLATGEKNIAIIVCPGGS